MCISGLEAVNCNDESALGLANLIVAGGVEYVAIPMGYDGGAWVLDMRVNNHTGFLFRKASVADLIATLEGFFRL